MVIVCPACGQRFVLSLPDGVAGGPGPGQGPTQVAEPYVPDKPLSPELIRAFYIGGGVLGFLALVAILFSLSRGGSAPPPPPAPAPLVTLPVAPPPAAVVPVEQPPPTTRRRPATGPDIKSLEVAGPPTTNESTTRPHRIVAVRPPASAIMDDAELDERIGHAIDLGCDFLLSKFKDGRLPEAAKGVGDGAGQDALVVYALLQASKAVSRPDLSVNGPLTASMLSALGGMPMTGNVVTYSRSLRAQALSVFNRPADRKVLTADAQFLIKVGRGGGYTYDPPIHTGNAAVVTAAYAADELNNAWDNSNSQYGALGVWAAEEAGIDAPSQYWGAVRKHWLRCQRSNGQWGYTDVTGNDGRLSMTVAGLTMMFVAEDHLGPSADMEEAGHPAYSASVARGLAWLSTGDNSVTLPGDYPAYTLYGLERAGLASGIKTFGTHDWYRELAAKQVVAQSKEGSWGTVIDTAFNLLFLARGRHPILFDKLQFDGAWANRPRDVANLTAFATKQLERPFNWQVVPLKAGWQNWMDAPVLYIASHRPPPFTPADIDQLRLYAENGGLIFTHADLAAAPFNAYVADLATKLFPRYKLRDLTPDDPIYQSLFPMARANTPLPRLQGVSNGSRLLLVHSPVDEGRTWQMHEALRRPVAFQLGLNLFIYSAGKSGYRNRLQTTFVPEPDVTPIATTSIARVTYGGDWNPEPAAAGRFARLFLKDTSIRVTVVDVAPADLNVHVTPVALLTGTGDVRFTAPQLKALRAFVSTGGVLVVDACGGSADARKSLLEHVLPDIAGSAIVGDLPANHPIQSGTLAGMAPLDGKLRRSAAELAGGRTSPVQAAFIGDGVLLFSPVDVTTGLLGTTTWGVDGYEPDAAYGLVRNALLYTLERAPLFDRQ